MLRHILAHHMGSRAARSRIIIIIIIITSAIAVITYYYYYQLYVYYYHCHLIPSARSRGTRKGPAAVVFGASA